MDTPSCKLSCIYNSLLGCLAYVALAGAVVCDRSLLTRTKYAAHAGQPDICRYLISEGADLSADNG